MLSGGFCEELQEIPDFSTKKNEVFPKKCGKLLCFSIVDKIASGRD